MERLVINIPEEKSSLVKQILKELGVLIQPEQKTNTQIKQRLANVSIWTDDELKVFEENKRAFENFKPEQW